jgi:mitochondrial fission protein ELM1
MAEEVAQAAARSGGSLLVSFTRRTPEPARKVLTERLGALPGWIWDDTGENPYFAFLAAADAILVTEDSTNLATDAAATGRPVHVLAMDGASRKFARFHADLKARGIARRFSGGLETWAYTPLDETERAAAELLRRYEAHTS